MIGSAPREVMGREANIDAEPQLNGRENWGICSAVLRWHLY